MAIKITRRERESSQSLIYRFGKAIRRGGLLVEARKKRFRKRPQSQQLKQRGALLREKKKAEYQKLKKLGKI